MWQKPHSLLSSWQIYSTFSFWFDVPKKAVEPNLVLFSINLLKHIFPIWNHLWNGRSKVMNVAWGYKKGAALRQPLSRPEKSPEDNVLNARWGFRDREGLFSPGLWVLQIHHECSGRRIFTLRVGGLVQLHIAMGVFSVECFPCLGPTTVLVVVPDARPHILFTTRKRRKNEEIEAHSLHTSSPLDADLSPLAGHWTSPLNRSGCFCFFHLTV